MSLVLDASTTMAWLFGEEPLEDVRAIFDRVLIEGATVPGIWRLEVANVLTQSMRRRQFTALFREQALDDLNQLIIEIDLETQDHAWGACLRLADLHNLTTYDASYLELAQRRRLPLATLDRRLAAAAREAGVPTLL